MKNQIVFLSGPDMCGKTQIAKALSRSLGVPYYKASTERHGFVNDQTRFIQDIRHACPARLDLLQQQMQQGIVNGIVYDRGYPCEFVYSTFFHRDTDLAAIKYLDDEYSKLGAVIVIPYRNSYEGIQDDLDPAIDSQKLEQLTQSYFDFAKITKCRVLKLNVDDENLDRELNDIMEFLNK